MPYYFWTCLRKKMDYQPYLYSKRALLIINPVAGRKAVNTQIAPIIRIFMEAGHAKTVLWVAASLGYFSFSASP